MRPKPTCRAANFHKANEFRSSIVYIFLKQKMEIQSYFFAPSSLAPRSRAPALERTAPEAPASIQRDHAFRLCQAPTHTASIPPAPHSSLQERHLKCLQHNERQHVRSRTWRTHRCTTRESQGSSVQIARLTGHGDGRLICSPQQANIHLCIQITIP